ncbi:hypothetical protein K458DRAFT_409391 [Lentithecium fluviatile CBS 122367]|uniref:polynucleotide adenylyltransferase n=1 Tax=Lentithecium fluviatile CBS 122367 TaxID=1168545 RepID=A0A6G1IIK1_9PLEO|nr:hypothetical protein K458DRAFT_409391 [Lentithecium fluviatile CBS 122367]
MSSVPRHDPAYLYAQHPFAIHSGPPQTSERTSLPGPPPLVSLSPSRYYSPLPALRAVTPNALFLLQPLLQLSRIDEVQSSAPPAPLPAVTVSEPATPALKARDPRPAAKRPSAKLAPAREQLDGSSGAVHSVSRNASMTSNGAANMGNKREEGAPYARAQRPSIVSQHSNSVPSTPLQVARQYESRSRSPSPNGGLGSHSPRSVSSEANSTMPTLRTGRMIRCKYETTTASGRRRMGYTSSEILEKAKEEPKKTLDPHEDKKLSGDMRELYDRLQPSKENAQRRDEFVEKLQVILETEFPGNEFKVHVFGSSGNMLYTSESDVDICIQTPMKRLEEMHLLAEALAKHGMEKVVCIPQAKVRIVKVWDPVLKLACDMNVNNTLALENTRMIKTYIQIDERVRPLAMIIKYWTKQRILNDAAIGGTISSYTWICMILNFLQTRDPPILPALHNLPYRAKDETTGKLSDSGFADDIRRLNGYGEKNKETLGGLLFHFFRKYGHELDYEKHVISVRRGCLLTREQKNWHLAGLQKEARNRLCVEEPFNTERNLGNSADEFSWRGVHLEIRRAFDLLVDGQHLGKVCEQYEFPPESAVQEKSTVFQKPKSTKPTLTSSLPARNPRNGGHRGGRGGFNGKGNSNYGRRSSSSASFGANRPFLNSPPISAMNGPDYFPRGLNEQLHDQLFQQYQMLEMQSNSLRAQLAAQQRAQQAHQAQVAQMHAQAVAHAQQNRGTSSTNGSPQKSPYVNGRSSPHLNDAGLAQNAVPNFLYHYPGFFDPAQASAAVPQDGPRTNPSSPSLASSVPGLRRQVHRASNASETASIRSQSQPARGMPPQGTVPGYPPMPQPYDPAIFAGYPIVSSTQEASGSQSATDVQYSPLSANPESVAHSDHGTPKEYVGYYVDEHLPPRPLHEYSVSHYPSLSELTQQRRRRVSSEITQPLLNSLRRVSRSPSPLGGHVRSYSTSVAPQAPHLDARRDRMDSARPPVDAGPVIVNGSFPTQPLEARSRSGTVDALPSADVKNPIALGILTNQDQYRMVPPEQRQQFVLEEIQRHRTEKLIGVNIANGSMGRSMNNVSPVETNGLTKVPSEGHRPQFPPLPEAWVNYEMSNGNRINHSEEVSPTRTQPAQWRPMPQLNGLPTLDTLNAPRAPPQEVKSATLPSHPLLSPVFETRTPSPNHNRQQEASKLVNGNKTHTKENAPQARRASHSAAHASAQKDSRNNAQKGNSPASEKGKANGGNHNSNGWQQQGRNKNKKKKGGNKTNEQKPSGEPLPANAADRKGG